MSRIARVALLFVVALGSTGCGSGPPVPPPAIVQGPHGGIAYNLGEGVGYAEVLNDPQVERSREETPTALVVYYLGTDGTSAMTPAPSAVSFTPYSKTESTKVPLEAGPESSDPAGASRFVSKPGPFTLGTSRGTVSGQREGKVISFSIAADR